MKWLNNLPRVGRYVLVLLVGLFGLSAAQQQPSPRACSYTKGRFVSKQQGIVMVLDLKGENLHVPGYEFLGPVPGYLYGHASQNIYGYWFVTDVKYLSRDSSKIQLKFMSDAAADPQQVLLVFKNDSIVQCKLENGIEMRRQVGNTRKLEKINGAFELVRE